MTLLHFDLRKPVQRTGFRTHFYKIQNFSKKATKSTQKAPY